MVTAYGTINEIGTEQTREASGLRGGRVVDLVAAVDRASVALSNICSLRRAATRDGGGRDEDGHNSGSKESDFGEHFECKKCEWVVRNVDCLTDTAEDLGIGRWR